MLTNTLRCLPFITEPDRVRYSDDAGVSEVLALLYYCKHCHGLRTSSQCLYNVETNYCPQCLETIMQTPMIPSALSGLSAASLTSPSAAFRENSASLHGNTRNECPQCFRCPLTGTSAALRSVMYSSTGGANDQTSPGTAETSSAAGMNEEKRYFLRSNYSQFSSTDDSSPEQPEHTKPPSASAPWNLKEHNTELQTRLQRNEHRISEIMSHYQKLAVQEKTYKTKQLQQNQQQQLQRNGYRIQSPPGGTTRPSSGNMHAKRGGTSSAIRKQVADRKLFAQNNPDELAITPAERKTFLTDDDADSVNVSQLLQLPSQFAQRTPLLMRLNEPAIQPTWTSELTPTPMPLFGRLALRCRECERVMYKLDINAHSHKIKQSASAYNCVPNVMLYSLPSTLTTGKRTKILLTITNPITRNLTVRLLPIPDPYERWQHLKAERAQEELNSRDFTETGLYRPRWMHENDYISEVELPQDSLFLLSRDSANAQSVQKREYVSLFPDDNKQVYFLRRYHKIGIQLHVTPQNSRQTWIAFQLVFDVDVRPTAGLASRSNSVATSEDGDTTATAGGDNKPQSAETGAEFRSMTVRLDINVNPTKTKSK